MLAVNHDKEHSNIAPFFGSTKPTQRTDRVKIKHRLPQSSLSIHSRVSAKLRRRGRDGQDASSVLQCSTCSPKLFCGGIALLGTFLLWRHSSGKPWDSARPTASAERNGRGMPSEGGRTGLRTGGGGRGVAEEKKLQLEVTSLESQLAEVKALLGVDPHVPLGSHNDGHYPWATSKGDINNRSVWTDVEPDAVHPVDTSSKRGDTAPSTASHDEQQDDRLQHGNGSAGIPRPTGVWGEPLFGQNPVRRPLTTDTSLIRTPVPLIVGGTDGSGTRGVVALLQRLKVPMVIEDRGTLDVHGAPYMAEGGWPAVVRPVVGWAQGAGYDADSAPAELRKSTTAALGRLKTKIEKLVVREKKRSSGQPTASYVTWGFKAPVSMLLVPFFQQVWGKAKFLHVIRDGRDIAFSGNQTPVSKFFEDTFPEGSRERSLTEMPLKSIRMWSVWNSGLYEWAARKRGSGGERLDYLLLHVEDLIDPSAKFAAIKDVAEFVGSPLSDKELCCIATEPSKDMGSHTAKRSERGKVTNRFGKWKAKVQGNEKLSQDLHLEGEIGLRLFGYEPERSLRASDGYQCLEKREADCSAGTTSPRSSKSGGTVLPPKSEQQNSQVQEVLPDTPDCVGMVKHADFWGRDIGFGFTEDHLGCCQECRNLSGCSHFTFDSVSGSCYLKDGLGSRLPKKDLISGAVVSQ